MPRPPRSGDAYLRFIPRTEMDIAVVGCGINVTLDGAGICTDARDPLDPATLSQLPDAAALADAGFTQAVFSIPPGQEHAIEDWGRIRRAFG